MYGSSAAHLLTSFALLVINLVAFVIFIIPYSQGWIDLTLFGVFNISLLSLLATAFTEPGEH